MKSANKAIPLILTAVIFSIPIAMDSCKDQDKNESPKKKDYTLTGTVKSTVAENDPVVDAIVTVNGKEGRTGKDGTFSIEADSSGRFVVKIRKKGFGTVTKIFHRSTKDYPYQMHPSFTKTIDPTRDNLVTDLVSATSCVGSDYQYLKFDAEYKRIPFVYDAKGNLVNFGWTPELKPLFDYLSGSPVCNPGASVFIPANSIVDSAGQPATTPVTISITTIDLASRDGMPGDNTYRDQSGTGVMVSYGAVTIELYSDREYYNLNPKTRARLSIPIEPVMLKLNKQIPKQIPLLYFDEKEAVWRQEGEQVATLNSKTNSYEAEISHLSSINMDYKMPDPTCFRLRQNPVPITTNPISPFGLHMLSVANGPGYSTTIGEEALTDCFRTDPDGDAETANETNLHLVYNAPAKGGQQICAIMTDWTYPGPPTAFYGIVIVNTPENAQGSLDFTCPCTTSGGTCSTPCDESTCIAFSPECGTLNFNIYPNDVILAGEYVSTTANDRTYKFRWIFKNPSAILSPGDTFSYTISYFHQALLTWVTMPEGGAPTEFTATFNGPVTEQTHTIEQGGANPYDARINITKVNGTGISTPIESSTVQTEN